MKQPLLAQFSSLSSRSRFRLLGALLFLVCYGLVVAAIIISKLDNLSPCPLCILQRVAFLLVGTVGFFSLIYAPTGILFRRILVSTALIFAMAGAGVALWHMYLQYSPPSLTCGPDLEYMVQNWPPARWLPLVFSGKGECTKIDWTLLGISMPTWSALCFLAITASALTYFVKEKQ